MSNLALFAARAKLMADAPLAAFFQNRYGRPARHFVGYKKPVSANDYPALCYVPIRAQRADSVGGMHKERVSIVIGIHESGITNDIFDGVTQLAAIEELVFNCLETGQLAANAMYLDEAVVTSDLSANHPFHELELSFLLAAR